MMDDGLTEYTVHKTELT